VTVAPQIDVVFPEYPKIETLYNRNPENMKKVVMGDLRKQEFGLIDRWLVTEKVDGTNIRVLLGWNDGEPFIRFGGRTAAAQMSTSLLDYLGATFPRDKVATAFDEGTTAVLYGEGYGPKIHKGGGLYRADIAFRLFDVAVIGQRMWWLNWNDVTDIAAKLDIQHVPLLGDNVTTAEAIALVSAPSTTAHVDGGAGCQQEGIVARCDPLLLMRDGKRMVWKLKDSDLS
jgi:ATP-dependent RNA circularization protein (DNA/RNA ligase family)